MVSENTIGRLCRYRSMLSRLHREGLSHVFSHQLSAYAGVTASQVRRDIRAVGHRGSPSRGYEVAGLLEDIHGALDAPEGERVAVVGVGNLGRALIAYFSGRRPRLHIAAAFDQDPAKVHRQVRGCPCYPMEELDRVVGEQGIRVAVLAVPAGAAQDVADRIVRAGIRGVLNFAPVRLRVPDGVYVEDMDMIMSLEKVAYFSRQQGPKRGR